MIREEPYIKNSSKTQALFSSLKQKNYSSREEMKRVGKIVRVRRKRIGKIKPLRLKDGGKGEVEDKKRCG